MKYNLKLITSVDIYVNIDHRVRVRVRVNKVVVYEGRSLKLLIGLIVNTQNSCLNN